MIDSIRVQSAAVAQCNAESTVKGVRFSFQTEKHWTQQISLLIIQFQLWSDSCSIFIPWFRFILDLNPNWELAFEGSP